MSGPRPWTLETSPMPSRPLFCDRCHEREDNLTLTRVLDPETHRFTALYLCGGCGVMAKAEEVVGR